MNSGGGAMISGQLTAPQPSLVSAVLKVMRNPLGRGWTADRSTKSVLSEAPMLTIFFLVNLTTALAAPPPLAPVMLGVTYTDLFI